MASEKTVHKTRVALAFRTERELRSLYRVLEITPAHVLFFFSGYRIRYEYYQGYLVRKGEDYPYLSADDYAFMFKEAEMLMNANIRGLTSNKGKTKQQKDLNPQTQLLLPLFFTGQRPTTGSHS